MGFKTGQWPQHDSNVIANAIRSLGFPNMTTGPFVAGGAVRRMFAGENTLKGFDIDVFPSSFEKGRGLTADEIVTGLYNRGNVILGRTMRNAKNAIVYQECLLGSINVQVMFDRAFSTAEALINDIDYTVCMAATDGWSWMADERMFEDAVTHKLRLNNHRQELHSSYRLAKYCTYGFTPEPGVFASVLGLDDPTLASQFKGGVRFLPSVY